MVTQFATARLGLILVNINPAYRLAELEYALNKVQCKAIVTASVFKTSEYLEMLRTLAPELNSSEPGELRSEKLPHLHIVIRMGEEKTAGMFNYDDVVNRISNVDREEIAAISATLSPEDAINIQFTSGTTGSPKGATLTHHNLVANICQCDHAIVYTPDGEVAGRYDKMVPLPFGEYLPLGETFPWLADLIQGPGSFRAGDAPVVFEGAKARMATPICYEAILGYVCRWYERPDLLVNVTNDAWFGQTAASPLHGMLAAIRAVELGIPLYRSAYTGLSFAAEPHGVIHSDTQLFEKVHRIITVRVTRFDTPYARYGDWFVALCVFGLVGALGAAGRARR